MGGGAQFTSDELYSAGEPVLALSSDFKSKATLVATAFGSVKLVKPFLEE